jgi:hypothetical protein
LILLSRQLTKISQATERKDHTVNIVTHKDTLKNCYKAGNTEPPVCSHYNAIGYMVEKCYKLHGYPPGHKLYKGRVTSSFTNQVVLSTSPNKKEVSEEKIVFTKE